MESERLNAAAMLASLSPALGAAEQMRNHYRAFDQTLDVLRKAQSLLQALKESETQRDAVLKEVRALDERKATLEREVTAWRQESREAKAHADREIAEARRKLGEEMQTLRRSVEEERERTRAILADAGAARQKALAPLEAEREALQQRVDTLKMELASVLARFQSDGGTRGVSSTPRRKTNC